MLEIIKSVNAVVNNFIWGVPAMICIIGVGLLLSVRTKFLQIRKFPYAMKSTIGKIFDKKDASDGAMTPPNRIIATITATEWGKDGINVNIVCPLAWTAQLENFEKAYPEAFKANVKMPPAGHYGDVEKEIGRVCVQLASPDFKYMNGETITLEGGMGQRP